MSAVQCHGDEGMAYWQGEATSVVALMQPLRPLLDAPQVMELCINRPGEVWCETPQGWQRHPVPAMSLARCLSLATAVATFCDLQISPDAPLLSATLPQGERIQFVIPPAVPRETVSLTIRKPSALLKDLEDFAREGLFTRCAPALPPRPRGRIRPTWRPGNTDAPCPDTTEQALQQLRTRGDLAAFLHLAVRSRQTIVVSGRTGCGKTTFMKGLIQAIPPEERLITIEDAAELLLPRHPNAVHLFYSQPGQGRVRARALLQACLRMKPDRILLAEIRGDECFEFLRLAASGHPGSITSVHAGSCALAFEQLALMMRQSEAGAGLGWQEIHALLRLVVDIVVQFDRDDSGRYISEICWQPRGARRGQVR